MRRIFPEPIEQRRVATFVLHSILTVCAAVGSIALLRDPTAAQDGPDPRAVLEVALGEAGIRIDLERGLCAVPARVLVTDELLEFLLVGPRGSAHESLFSTEVAPSLLNTALLSLGIRAGQNARWVPRDPVPTAEQRKQGLSPVEVFVPEGDGFYLYALWKESDRVYFHRVDDLIRNLKTGRTLLRHRWVYLGSRFEVFEKDRPEEFVADREGNLINIAFFGDGNTLVTAALEDCREQTIWIANPWLLPKRGWPVQFVFSREPVVAPPQAWIRALVDPDSNSAESVEATERR